MPPLSFSKISTYQTCPLSYKFQYVDKLPAEEKWYFSFGSTLHLCAEYFFRVKVPPPPAPNACSAPKSSAAPGAGDAAQDRGG